jgi:hypothetical protein
VRLLLSLKEVTILLLSFFFFKRRRRRKKIYILELVENSGKYKKVSKYNSLERWNGGIKKKI